MCRFISGIKVYTHVNEHTPEGEMILAAYFHALQEIVIENAVVDAFTGGTLLVKILILLGIPGDTRLETSPLFFM